MNEKIEAAHEMWEKALWGRQDLAPTLTLFNEILAELNKEVRKNTALIAVVTACKWLVETDMYLQAFPDVSSEDPCLGLKILRGRLTISAKELTGIRKPFSFIDVENVRLAIMDRLKALK